jgi:cytochrome d ubiquinol oxidase subunit II
MSGYGHAAEGLILVGLSAYLLLGGADFGAGLWHLVARRRDEQRVIEHAMGPIWEANHVWLIFVLVISWTAFPPVFAQIMNDHWVPLSLAVLGIVIRGSAFVFFKAVPERADFAWAFGVASVLTPFCLGYVAGTVTTGHGIFAGVLTVALCAYLAAVYLTWDAQRTVERTVERTGESASERIGVRAGERMDVRAGERMDVRAAERMGIRPGERVGETGEVDTAERFRSYALGTGALTGLIALPGAAVLGVRSPLIALSALAGVVSLVLLWRRAYVAVRMTAALAVVTVLWGAASAGDLPLRQSVAGDAVLQVVFVALAVGAVVLLPSMALLYYLFQHAPQHGQTDG